MTECDRRRGRPLQGLKDDELWALHRLGKVLSEYPLLRYDLNEPLVEVSHIAQSEIDFRQVPGLYEEIFPDG